MWWGSGGSFCIIVGFLWKLKALWNDAEFKVFCKMIFLLSLNETSNLMLIERNVISAIYTSYCVMFQIQVTMKYVNYEDCRDFLPYALTMFSCSVIMRTAFFILFTCATLYISNVFQKVFKSKSIQRFFLTNTKENVHILNIKSWSLEK